MGQPNEGVNEGVNEEPLDDEDRSFDESDRGKGGTNEYVPDHVLNGGRDFRVEGNDVSGYIGVDPEYQTYANDHDKPLLTDVERFNLTDQYDHLEGNLDREAEQAQSADEVEQDEQLPADERTAPPAVETKPDNSGLLIAPQNDK